MTKQISNQDIFELLQGSMQMKSSRLAAEEARSWLEEVEAIARRLSEKCGVL